VALWGSYHQVYGHGFIGSAEPVAMYCCKVKTADVDVESPAKLNIADVTFYSLGFVLCSTIRSLSCFCAFRPGLVSVSQEMTLKKV